MEIIYSVYSPLPPTTSTSLKHIFSFRFFFFNIFEFSCNFLKPFLPCPSLGERKRPQRCREAAGLSLVLDTFVPNRGDVTQPIELNLFLHMWEAFYLGITLQQLTWVRITVTLTHSVYLLPHVSLAKTSLMNEKKHTGMDKY